MSAYLTETALSDYTTARAADINSRFQLVVSAFDLLPSPTLVKLSLKPTVTAGGSGNALTITNEQPVLSYASGQRISFIASAGNTGPATANVDGLGVKEIRRHEGSALVSGDILSGRVYDAVYDGTYFQLMQTTAVELAGPVSAAAASAAAALVSQNAAAVSAAAALASQNAAAVSASDAATSAASLDTSNIVHRTGAESIAGAKTFSSAIVASAGITINSQTLDTLSANGCSLVEATNYSAMRTLLSLVPGTDVLAMSGGTLTGALTLAADPATALGAATKQYVDAIAAGLDPKPSVRFRATSNVTVSNPGTSTFDSGTATSGDRILLADQSTASQNGIYVFNGSSSAMTRATDMDSWAEIPGAFFFVEEGTTYADRGYMCTANSGGTLGSTAVTFSQFTPGGAYAPVGAITSSGLTMATGRLLGRTTASSGATEEITVGAGLSLSAGTLSYAGTVLTSVLASSTGYTSSTPAAALQITFPSTGTYRVTVYGSYLSTSTSTGLGISLALSPAQSLGGQVSINNAASGTPTFGSLGGVGGSSSLSGGNAAVTATAYGFLGHFSCVVSATGTLDVKFFNTAGTGTITVAAGAILVAEKLL